MSLRRRTWEILEMSEPGDRASHYFDVALISLIYLNVIAVIAGSMESVKVHLAEYFEWFQAVTIIVFTIEYLARVWSCTADPWYSDGIKGRLRYMRRPMMLVDLLAILPYYMPFLGIDLRSLRILRLSRAVQISRVGRYYSSLCRMGDVIQSRKEELVLSGILIILLIVVSSTVLYYCERTAQPDIFSSIPATMWWSVVTLSTVGYGDMHPVTAMGKVCAGVIAMIGVGMFALPAGILGSGFVEAVRNNKNGTFKCPHCGEEIPERH